MISTRVADEIFFCRVFFLFFLGCCGHQYLIGGKTTKLLPLADVYGENRPGFELVGDGDFLFFSLHSSCGALTLGPRSFFSVQRNRATQSVLL